MFWTLSHRNRVYRRRVEDNILRSTFTQCYVYIRPIDFLHEVFLVSILNHDRSILQSISFRTSNSQNTHTTEKILYSMHLISALNCFEKNTQTLLIVIITLEPLTFTWRLPRGSRFLSACTALNLFGPEKNKNAPLIVLIALH